MKLEMFPQRKTRTTLPTLVGLGLQVNSLQMALHVCAVRKHLSTCRHRADLG